MSAPTFRTQTGPSEGRPVRQFGVGRQCLLCGAVLSRYNPSRFCFIHHPKNLRLPAVPIRDQWGRSAASR